MKSTCNLKTNAVILRSPYLTFPNSWFRVASSDELLPGGVIPLRYFGKDFVLFRTKDGTPHILDAHCPHLGAHLGYGGRVEGETIQCPFHGWMFCGNGQCTDVPYATKVLPEAQIRSWPVREVDGLIMMYYHAEGSPPQWNIPGLSEYTSGEWTPLRSLHQWKIRTNIEEYGENSYDTAHFSYIHSHTFSYAKSESIKMDGSVLIHEISAKLNPSFATRIIGVNTALPIKITRHGPGYEIFNVSLKGKIDLDWLYLFITTPIDEEYLAVHLLFSMKRVFNKPVTSLLARIINQDIKKSQEDDILIWENKIYHSNPILCEGDGPIMQYRRWVRQFHSDIPVMTLPEQQ